VDITGVIPRHTLRFANLGEGDVGRFARIVAAKSATEARGQLPLWDAIASQASGRVIWIDSVARESVLVRDDRTAVWQAVNLNDDDGLLAMVGAGPILLDISGLPNSVWAPIVKVALQSRVELFALYAEPDSYRPHPSPSSASYFDLTARLEGLAPLPGFARLSGPPDENRCLFVALLGFEGNRPSCLIVQVDPLPRVVSIIGVPGFQLEFPAYTVACNRQFLDDNRAYGEIRFARASCPFEVVSQLRELHRDYAEHYFYIAPVGTKPHALGAVLYALECPGMTEIMFDHPVRKLGRTSGVGTIHMYDLGGHRT